MGITLTNTMINIINDHHSILMIIII